MFLNGRHEDEEKQEIGFHGIFGSYSDHLSLSSKDGPIKSRDNISGLLISLNEGIVGRGNTNRDHHGCAKSSTVGIGVHFWRIAFARTW